MKNTAEVVLQPCQAEKISSILTMEKDQASITIRINSPQQLRVLHKEDKRMTSRMRAPQEAPGSPSLAPSSLGFFILMSCALPP